ncbi:MAG: hypothetical protein PHH59_12435 [Methylovulum sp.]|uniref:hypothetical protein n=1 Tax=Methylovulum sp. TaxID=1916980 RepID=UPI002634E752|nr:hypothetical protein [Methylovulum sp.]MDD2724815.1 hypothetical protein [Methylovulum sp.]MDD5124061.1 hypothetical protein [Methylovulum sp.]
MKTSTLERNGISKEVVALVSRLVGLIPGRRCAMGDATLSLLDGKHRAAEDVLGWNRSAVEVGINEFKTGITCINDLSLRLKPATEVKSPSCPIKISIPRIPKLWLGNAGWEALASCHSQS